MKNDSCIEIYVHIPFCVRKCDYCDFVSFACKKDVHRAYFESLKKQIRYKSETTGRLPVVSVFFGGGTPTSVDASYIVEILDTIKECYDLQKDAEITIEMNPNSADFEKISTYKKAGINRLSIGLQSADDEELKTLSRLHTYAEFERTYNDAKRAGFENINVDIMSALPGQTLASHEKTLEKVLSLSPKHISAYSLIIEEGTPFFERYGSGEGLPDEDTERRMYYRTEEILSKHGYHRYEISNYSKEGFECAHNIGYWTGVPYLGFGIAAASYYENKRYAMNKSLDEFINGDFEEDVEELSKEDMMAEFMFLGLRMMDGVKKSEFLRRFHVSMDDVYGEALSKHEKETLLVNSDVVKLTKKGVDVSNYVMASFLP